MSDNIPTTPLKTVALIPARGGSKGLPGKNIKDLCGKPMLAYTLEAALGCPMIDGVFLSTDCPEIAAVGKAWGARVDFMRPAELATDTASSHEVIRHFMDWLKGQTGAWPETLILLQPTSPLRSVHHVMEALAMFHSIQETVSLQSDAEPSSVSVVSVTEGKPLAWLGTIGENQSSEGLFSPWSPLLNPDKAKQRQGAEKAFALNGALYIAPAQQAYHQGFLTPPVYPYIMPAHAAVDVDTEEDFALAEFWMKRHLEDMNTFHQARALLRGEQGSISHG